MEHAKYLYGLLSQVLEKKLCGHSLCYCLMGTMLNSWIECFLACNPSERPDQHKLDYVSSMQTNYDDKNMIEHLGGVHLCELFKMLQKCLLPLPNYILLILYYLALSIERKHGRVVHSFFEQTTFCVVVCGCEPPYLCMHCISFCGDFCSALSYIS